MTLITLLATIVKLLKEIDSKYSLTYRVGGFSNNNNDIYQTCDKLLYTAKKSGKNKIIYKPATSQ
ncbi:MAG: hypothetical protein ACRCV2_04720 [Cetobacterium sp.]